MPSRRTSTTSSRSCPWICTSSSRERPTFTSWLSSSCRFASWQKESLLSWSRRPKRLLKCFIFPGHPRHHHPALVHDTGPPGGSAVNYCPERPGGWPGKAPHLWALCIFLSLGCMICRPIIFQSAKHVGQSVARSFYQNAILVLAATYRFELLQSESVRK